MVENDQNLIIVGPIGRNNLLIKLIKNKLAHKPKYGDWSHYIVTKVATQESDN